MKILILPEFIEDLKSLDKIDTLGRVLDKLFDSGFNFKTNRDDHRYKGVDDAWIRDISKGVTAYRSIFIRKDDKIYLYRTGTKKIEENLPAPDLTGTVFELGEFKVEIAKQVESLGSNGAILRSPEPLDLFQEVMKFNHVPLKELWIVSPTISKELFSDTNHIGKFINKVAEDNAAVMLITLPPENPTDVYFYDSLEIKNIIVLYNERIHAKLWYFGIDFENANPSDLQAGLTNAAILGSANLTVEGYGQHPEMEKNTLELCYRLPPENSVEFYQYCNYLCEKSLDHNSYKNKYIKDGNRA